MSLYNMVCGHNEYGSWILALLGLTAADFGRPRDVYLLKENGKYLFGVYARVGGGNRVEYMDIFNKMSSHQKFVREFDDDYDSTYAHFIFDCDSEIDQETRNVIENNWDNIAESHPIKKFNKVMENLTNSGILRKEEVK